MNRGVALHHHLVHNHFPPIDPSFIPVAEQAIDIAQAWRYDVFESNDLSQTITMPNGVTLTVVEIMEQLHLWVFLDGGDDD